MNDYILLKNKLLDFVGGETDEQILTALNAKTIAAKSTIDPLNIESYLTIIDKWLPIYDGTTDATRIAVQVLRRFPAIDLRKAGVEVKLTSVLDGLITEAKIATEDKAAILAMGEVMQSWSDQNWPHDVHLGDIQNARAI